MPLPADVDPFDSLLNLEDQYYHEGYQQGVEDGSQAGRIDGRIFGLEKGFEKFLAMGKLNGRASIWNAQLSQEEQEDKVLVKPQGNSGIAEQEQAEDKMPSPGSPEANPDEPTMPEALSAHEKVQTSKRLSLSPMPRNKRLAKHVDTLLALTEPETFSTQNDEDSVADFDDRLKRAEAKARLISSILKEDATAWTSAAEAPAGYGSGGSSRGVALKRDDVRGGDSIEDFGSRARKGAGSAGST